MTLREYYLRMEAWQLAELHKQSEMLTQAWLNQTVQATEGKGNHIRQKYTKPEQILDVAYQTDQIRKQFEPTYRVSTATSTRNQKERAYDTFNKNIEMYRKLKASGKLDELRKRKKGGSK